MKKTILIILALGIFLAMAVSPLYAYQATMGPTEMIYWDESKAYNGYTLFTPIFFPTSWLIDMEGNVVHSWNVPGMNPQLLENGNLLIDGPREIDWDGNTVFEYTGTPVPNYAGRHHDTIKIFNTKINAYTYLFNAYGTIPYEEAIAHGADPECDISEDHPPTPGYIFEVDMNGNLVWYWTYWDHIVQDYDPTKLSYGDPTAPENWGKLDINVDTNTRTGLTVDWNHTNSLDYNPALDQICFNSRELGEFYVVDHSLTTEEAAGPAGDFIFRWGNPANYGQGDPPAFNHNGHEQLFGAHDIQWIDAAAYTGGPALPGAGHFLVFENASFRPQIVDKSWILEINPYDGPMENGVYIPQHDAGYFEDVLMAGGGTLTGKIWNNISNQVVWHFNTAMLDQWFFGMLAKGMYSAFISSTQRLPNGNTLMCSGEDGNFVEVTAGVPPEVVWEYIMPAATGGIVTQMGPGEAGGTFRCYRYGPDHPGLAGRDLTPQGTLTGRIPGTFDRYPESVPITGWGIPPGTSSEAGGGAATGEGGGGY